MTHHCYKVKAMNSIPSIKTLSSQIQAVEAAFGVDACIEHAERVYSQSFRSEPMRICDVLNANCSSQEQYYAEFNELVREVGGSLIERMYTLATGVERPCLDEEDEDDQDVSFGYGRDEDDEYLDMMADADFEAWSFAVQEWSSAARTWASENNLNIQDLINEETLVVALCNYKGEGEGGYELYDEHIAKLPVFVSKRHSFNI